MGWIGEPATIFVHPNITMATADEEKLLSGGRSEADGLAAMCCGDIVKDRTDRVIISARFTVSQPFHAIENRSPGTGLTLGRFGGGFWSNEYEGTHPV